MPAVKEQTLFSNQTLLVPFAEVLFGKTHTSNLTVHFSFNAEDGAIVIDKIFDESGNSVRGLIETYEALLLEGIRGNSVNWNNEEEWW